MFPEDKAAQLRPLPSIRRDDAQWAYNRSVNPDFHVVYTKNRYPVPHRHAGCKVDPCAGVSAVGIYHAGERIAAHRLSPPSVLKLSKRYGRDQLEAACVHARAVAVDVAALRARHGDPGLRLRLGRRGAVPGAGGASIEAGRPRAQRRQLQGSATMRREGDHMGDEKTRRKIREMIYEDHGIDLALIREAGTCQFAAFAANVVIEGYAGAGKSYLAYCIARRACEMRRSARHVLLPVLLMRRDELAAVGRPIAKILREYARFELLVIDKWLTEDVDGDAVISFLFELIEGRYASKSTVLCAQNTPAEWHGRLGGGVQADAMVDRPVHGSVRIDLGDVIVRKLLAE